MASIEDHCHLHAAQLALLLLSTCKGPQSMAATGLEAQINTTVCTQGNQEAAMGPIHEAQSSHNRV
jgi:putative intracellular protease/amidase